MNINQDAIDATAQAVYEEFRIDLGGAYAEWPKHLTELEDLDQAPFLSKAKFYLEAGAPHLQARQ